MKICLLNWVVWQAEKASALEQMMGFNIVHKKL